MNGEDADGTKLEISGKNNKEISSNSPSATYKQIPEDDMEDQVASRPKSLVKSPSNEPDGADEKMLPDAEQKVSPGSKVNLAEVKFTNNEKQNGDAKLDIGEIKSEFVGMTKEELMKYANDPFWVRLRWFLFILFWLAWAGMLVGAIMIIIAAPTCAPPEPKTWWEQGPLVESEAIIDLDFEAIKSNGILGLIVPYPEDSYTALNGSEDFNSFLKKAKDNEMKVIVELVPAVSDTWFEKSESKDGEFSDMYIWGGREGVSESDDPPNNWLSTDSTADKKISAWKYSPNRKQFYLTQSSQPQLNFRLPQVVEKFTNVIKTFLDAGVSGIRLKGATGLVVDKKFESNPVLSSPSNYQLYDYNYYSHIKTTNLHELGPILKQWRDIVKNKTENGVFMLNDDLNSVESYKVNNSLIIDLPKQSQVFTENDLTAIKLKNGLDAAYRMFNNSWPIWKVHSPDLSNDVLNIVAYLLKGTTIVASDYKVDTELKVVRESPSIIHGSDTRYVVANNSVFAYVRVHSGNPGYVVAVNPTDETVEVDFHREIPMIPEELTVHYHSKSYNETGYEMKAKKPADKFPLSAKSSVVLSYVPKEID